MADTAVARPTMRVEREDPRVLTIRIDVEKSPWEQWFLLRSDAHHDNLHCDQTLEKKHLDQALQREAGILDFGDLFCAMQGKWDKRSDQDQMRPELQGNKYLDKLVSYNSDFYQPYANNWLMMSRGNHEDAVLRRHQTDLTERLTERLGERTGAQIYPMPYAGWIRFMFTIHGGTRTTRRLWYTHGYGGGGPVTKDVIQTARQAAFLADADLVVSGHTHDHWILPIARVKLLDSGRPVDCETLFIKCGGYKDEFIHGTGWAVGKGHPPKPRGACWLRFYSESSEVRFEAVRAQ